MNNNFNVGKFVVVTKKVVTKKIYSIELKRKMEQSQNHNLGGNEYERGLFKNLRVYQVELRQVCE